MSSNNLQQAKMLIQQKRYDEARRILQRSNDPKAKVWLSQLDEIAPIKRKDDYSDLGDPFSNIPTRPPQNQPQFNAGSYDFVTILAMFYYLIGGLIMLGGSIGGFSLIADAGNSYYYSTGLRNQGIAVIITSFIMSVSLLGVGQLLQIMVDLARNSRTQTHLLNMIADKLDRK